MFAHGKGLQKLRQSGKYQGKLVKKLFPVFVLVALVCFGCARPTWIPYVGAQQNWTTSPGAFIETNRSLPVYYGNPPVNYIVLGQISLWSQNEMSGPVSSVADEAKARGADAIIVGPSASFPVGGVLFPQATTPPGSALGSAFASPMMMHDLTAVAIKWKNTTSNPKLSQPKQGAIAQNHRPANTGRR